MFVTQKLHHPLLASIKLILSPASTIHQSLNKSIYPPLNPSIPQLIHLSTIKSIYPSINPSIQSIQVEPGTCLQKLVGSVRTGVILKDVSLEVFLIVFGLFMVFVLVFSFVFVFVFKVEPYTRMSFLRKCPFFH